MRLGELTQGRSNNFDFLRFLLAALVLISHSFLITTGHERGEVLVVLTGGQTTLGAAAVAGFFLISGYLITQSWMHCRGLADFLRRRALRIYPAFLVGTLACALVFGPLGSGDPTAYLGQTSPTRVGVRAVALATPGVPPTFLQNPHPGPVNVSLWTIQYEVACYLLVVLLGLLGLVKRAWLPAALFSVCYGVWMLQLYGGLTEIPLLPDSVASQGFRLAAFFLAGTCAYLLRDRIPMDGKIATGAVAVTAAASIAGVLNAALPFTLTYVLFAVAVWRRLPLQRFARYGDFSYGLYVYAYPVQSLATQTLHIRSPWWLSAVALAATCVLAVLSWHIVEKWALRLKGPGERGVAVAASAAHAEASSSAGTSRKT